MGRTRIALALLAASAAGAFGCASKPAPRAAAARKAASPPVERRGSSWYYAYRHDLYVAQRAAPSDGKGSALDHVLVAGARFVANRSGRIEAAAWEHASVLGERLSGTHAVLPSLGGGFVHFAGTGDRSTLFASREFTGPLEPIAELDLPLRGARNGPSSVVLLSDWGPVAFDARAKRLIDVGLPALGDVVSLDGKVAVWLDLFARAHVTRDGGGSWQDVHKELGLPVRGLSATPTEVLLDTGVGRGRLRVDGKLVAPTEGYFRGYYDYQRPFQLQLPGMGQDGTGDAYWGHYAFRESPAAAIAIESGVPLGDGRALGARRGAIFLVDQTSGELLELHMDWANGTNECEVLSVEPVPADPRAKPRELLYLCHYDDGETWGRCVLRGEGASPPSLERCFDGAGSFVHTDEGGLAFVGSCAEGEGEPDDGGRYRWDPRPAPMDKVCARRGRGDWVERHLELDADETVEAWVPARGGQVTALVRPSGLSLPNAVPARARARRPRTVEEGVRVLRPKLPRGWAFGGTSFGYDGGWELSVDRRFGVDADGSVWAWVSPSSEEEGHNRWSAPSLGVRSPARISPDGDVELLGSPAGARFASTGGRYGVAVLESGALLETVDHGLSWQPAGDYPLSPDAGTSGRGGSGCSEMGCQLGFVSRLGWGPSELPIHATRAGAPLLPPPRAARRPRLTCRAAGPPAPIAAARQPNSTRVSTGWGDTFTLIHETDDPAAIKTDEPLLSTGTFVYWPPLELDREPRRINGTNLPKQPGRAQALALVDAAGKVSLLVQGDGAEALVEGAEVVGFKTERRWGGYGATMTGVRLGRERGLTVSERNGRTGVEMRGPPPIPPLFAFGSARQIVGRRPISLGVSKDGTPAVVVVDPSPSRPAALALLSGAGAALDRIEQAAGFADAKPADDPACEKLDGVRTLVPLLGADWLEVGGDFHLQLGPRQNGLALVRWTPKLVCVEAVHVSGTTDGDPLTIVARFDRKKGKGPSAVVRSSSMSLPAACSWERPR